MASIADSTSVTTGRRTYQHLAIPTTITIYGRVDIADQLRVITTSSSVLFASGSQSYIELLKP